MSAEAGTSAASLPIALDAAGGDHGAAPNVEGAVLAARAGVHVLLVGERVALHAELGKFQGSAALPIEIVDAPDVIGMDEHASDVRSRTGASINVCTRLVREGHAAAAVSMGHSGATMASALLTFGRIKGVERPAILTHLPARGGMTTLLDAGANADVKASYFAQWARLATVYLKVLEDQENPTVGLLSIGEEAHKGSALVLEAHALLRELHGRGINFHGNVEGRDVFLGTTDIVVTDGFTGNVVLKLAEGEAKVMFGWIRDALNSGLKSKVGGLLVRGSLRSLAERMDPSTYGASILIGVRGLAFIGHGSADATAVKNALLRAARAHEGRLLPRLEAAFGAQAASTAPVDEVKGTEQKET
ncbi:phosphate acyltransferase PlsX [Deinococcus radiopugnans]|uniref:Phosphate acyltransferase n=1 Tax=Deinococcus radiopugnans ATCC 19172 TaxID=585398 RepID=A0A5C4Y7G0_9DEIO|nr:phosphate acyltransferase PlsX [Deinococcus radiopugnans]MBB6015069.1 glycerol-3-phosphate acyltransferase PlsX [Deinococcus radiopugnans ATCC 19172]TNM70955.1 phosphate acyltransferase PlsX [Deinococcus radiopugnans ATCC 19172]